MKNKMKKVIYILGILFIVLILIYFFVLPPVYDGNANSVKADTLIKVSKIAEALHKQLWIADLHCDALLWNRNLLKRNHRGHVDIPRMLEGNVALQAFTIVSKTPFGLNFQSNPSNSDMLTLLLIAQRWPIKTWFSLKQRALYQAQKLHKFAQNSNGKFAVIKSKTELRQYIERRNNDHEITAGFLGLEGAQVLEGKLENLKELYEAGFRMMSPSHFFDTEVGGSAHGVEKYGLTELGKKVITKMEALGMLVDLAHASPKTIDDVLAMATRPVVDSHTGVKGTCNNIRNLSDEHIKGIAATGGVIGIAFFKQATCGDDVAAIVNAIKYTTELVGLDHVALGSDFDGSVQTPFDAAHLVLLTQGLMDAGFSEEEIAKIMGGNVRRLLLETLPEN